MPLERLTTGASVEVLTIVSNEEQDNTIQPAGRGRGTIRLYLQPLCAGVRARAAER